MPEYRDVSTCCQCFQPITYEQSGWWRGDAGITCRATKPPSLHRTIPPLKDLKDLSMEGVEAWLDL